MPHQTIFLCLQLHFQLAIFGFYDSRETKVAITPLSGQTVHGMVSPHTFSVVSFRRRRCLLIQKKKGNPKLQYSSQNQLDEVSHWYPYPRQAAKFGNFVTLFQKDGNFIYQNLFDPVQPFFAFLQSFGSYCYRTEAQYSTSFYWQNAQNRIVILDRYIILIFIWMYIIICCLQKIPRSV